VRVWWENEVARVASIVAIDRWHRVQSEQVNKDAGYL